MSSYVPGKGISALCLLEFISQDSCHKEERKTAGKIPLCAESCDILLEKAV
jgi:hypothetical protein